MVTPVNPAFAQALAALTGAISVVQSGSSSGLTLVNQAPEPPQRLTNQQSQAASAVTVPAGQGDVVEAGRPRINVSKDSILALRKLNYSWVKVARMLDISRSTLYRRLEEYNIHTGYSNLSSAELNELLKDIKKDHPNAGEVMIQGHLLQLGIKVPREKLRTAIHEVDHDNTVKRRSHVIKRRVYSVPHPNALWHIDGNHKMIRWRLIVHAGVDGFSRCIVFLKCANNNCAPTVLESFMLGASAFGLPDCVRTDCGGENIDIWHHMLSTHNNLESCVLTGSSTHNERVERLWRDVYRCVSSGFVATFHSLESEGILDPLNEVDIFILHFIYLPRVNKCLCEFQNSWNFHSLSTEGNMSPFQLFMEGCCVNQQADDTSIEHSSTPLPQSEDTVDVPSNKFVPCSQLLVQLQSAIDPLMRCDDFGKELYRQAIHLTGQHLQLNCNDCKV